MSSVVIKDSHLKFSGKTYFRGGAEDVEIGSIGEKCTPLTKTNYLEVKDRISPDKLEVAEVGVFTIDASALTKADIGLKISALVPVKGVPVAVSLGVDESLEKMKSAKLKLVKFTVQNNHMINAINQSPNKRSDLKKWGMDARVAHQVFVVVEASLASALASSPSVALSVGVNKLITASLAASGSHSSTLSLTLPKDVCFAYLLAKPKWDGDKVDDLDDDQWGLG